MRDSHFGFRHFTRQKITRLGNILDARAHIKRLPAAIALAQQGFTNDQGIKGRHETAHGQTIHRRRGNQRQFAHTGQSQLQCAWNGRGREC